MTAASKRLKITKLFILLCRLLSLSYCPFAISKIKDVKIDYAFHKVVQPLDTAKFFSNNTSFSYNRSVGGTKKFFKKF